jgi:ABC-2 type transport system ATP-binding protein
VAERLMRELSLRPYGGEEDQTPLNPLELPMIEVSGLTKRYGDKTAVKDLTFTVKPGIVTGFLGPNGAGKSTTMRMIAGLDAPTSGTALVNGRPYQLAQVPMAELGILLEAKAVHTSRSAYNHLLALAQTNGVPRSRVAEVIDLVGLKEVARKRAGGFSLGMGQRLGIASALLGDPQTVVLDEPINGLDPEGILWVRNLLKSLAAQGRTVFISSHLMSEMALTAHHLIVVGRGELIADVDVEEFVAMASTNIVLVRSPQATQLRELLQAPDVSISSAEAGVLEIRGVTAETIGDLAYDHQIRLHELTVQQASLEDAFMEMTRDAVEFHAHPTTETTGEHVPAPAHAGDPR